MPFKRKIPTFEAPKRSSRNIRTKSKRPARNAALPRKVRSLH